MKKIIIKGFTLIEVIVTITIFSIIMISVVSIYMITTETSNKSDVNRIMQENLKSIITEVGEDIIKNGIKGTTNNLIDGCDMEYTETYKKGNTLCVGNTFTNNYYLAKKDIVSGNYNKVDMSQCESDNETCYIVKNSLSGGEIAPITNSLVTIKELSFYTTRAYNVNKVTIIVGIQASRNSGIKANLIKESKISFETTISERPLISK